MAPPGQHHEMGVLLLQRRSDHAAIFRPRTRARGQVLLLHIRIPPLQSEVFESVAPSPGKPGRLAWGAWQDGDEDSALDVYHAWLIEDLDHGRVRILTQESQIGKPAAELATKKPNPMLNGHQDWLDGLVGAARKGN